MIRAIIFDLDGTLADTETLHLEAFNDALKAEGIEISRADYFARLIGYQDSDCFTIVMKENRRALDETKLQALITGKAATYQNFIAQRDVMFPGAADFVRQCAERFSLSLATGTCRAEAEMILRGAGLRDLFADIVGAEDVEHGKPAPDCMLAALGRLSFILRPKPPFEAQECLVIEDTAAGIESAHGAGMPVLAVCHSASAAELGRAEIVRQSFGDIDLDEVLRDFAKR
ncbi:MAG: HAD family hydrolase [Candidatus Binataceae bacterium]